MNKLSDILSKIDTVSQITDIDMEVSTIAFDSRKCVLNTLFIAVNGTLADGHDFIYQAIENGAKVIVCESIPTDIKDKAIFVLVKNSRIALAKIASAYYDHPSKELKLTGVTGTNGKTSVATILFNLFNQLGYHCGLISTVQNKIGNRNIEATHTTPDPIQLNKLFREMVNDGVSHCFMEVSSHAIDQNRIAGLSFTGGIFTNITRDHLDYHKTFDKYIVAKKGFFDHLPEDAFALTNNDDRNGMVMLQNTKAKKYTFSQKSVSDFKAKIIENHFEGLHLKIEKQEIWTKLVGSFNAYNFIAAYGAAILLGEHKDEILPALSLISSAEGRFNFFKSEDGINVIIDYAHTPDALENVLSTIHDIKKEGQNIITVVGAGGNRDKGKRPLMGKIGAELSHHLILTSDNPRDEDPETILKEMAKGISSNMLKNTLCIVDRKQAIKTACFIAHSGDIILIAGKGHEKTQIIKDTKLPFDDKKIVKDFLKK